MNRITQELLDVLYIYSDDIFEVKKGVIIINEFGVKLINSFDFNFKGSTLKDLIKEMILCG